jgi:hypothetical protein
MNFATAADKKREEEEGVVSRSLERAMKCVDYTGAKEHITLMSAAIVAGIFIPPSDIAHGQAFIRERIRRVCFRHTDIRAQRALVSRFHKAMDYYHALWRNNTTKDEQMAHENERLYHHCHAFFLRVCADHRMPLRVLRAARVHAPQHVYGIKTPTMSVHDDTTTFVNIGKCTNDEFFNGCLVTRTEAMPTTQPTPNPRTLQYHVDSLVVRDVFGDPHPWVCNVGGDTLVLLPKDVMLDYYLMLKELEAFQLCLWLLREPSKYTGGLHSRVVLDRNVVKMIESVMISQWVKPAHSIVTEKKFEYYPRLQHLDNKRPWLLCEDEKTRHFFRTVRRDHPEIPNPPKPHPFAPPPNAAFDSPAPEGAGGGGGKHVNKRPPGTGIKHVNKRPRVELAPPPAPVVVDDDDDDDFEDDEEDLDLNDPSMIVQEEEQFEEDEEDDDSEGDDDDPEGDDDDDD